MEVLVSFNNTYQSPGYPMLGVLNPEDLSLRFVDLPGDIPETGMLGLAVSSKYIFAAVQDAFNATTAYRVPPEIGLQYSSEGVLASESPCSLLILDKISFAVVHHHLFDVVRDVHSFLLSEDETQLYVVSTGTDEIIRIELDGAVVKSENVFWRPATATERVDNHHLNSIISWRGDIIVSGFGQKEIPDDWNSAKDGFVYNLTKEKFLVKGLQQPHSLAIIHGQLAYCESKQKCVRFMETNAADNEPESLFVGGYSRGLCAIDDDIFVGTSARRNRSKSTGKLLKNVEGVDLGCTITKFSKNGLPVVTQLGDVANEIYELLPVENTASWPFRPLINYKKKFEEAWENQIGMAMQEIKKHVHGHMPLVLVDELVLGLQQRPMNGFALSGFIEKDGIYWGPPENDGAALTALKDLEDRLDQFAIVFAWPAFWWLDSFKGFNEHLHAAYSAAFANDRVKIFVKK